MLTATQLDFDQLHRLRSGAVLASADRAVFRITGPGALDCIQGLWTNDLLQAEDGAFTYGALLTPKGMIIADGWSLRTGDDLTLVLPAATREAVELNFRRSLPPRLATASELSSAITMLLLLGDGALERWPVLPLGRLPAPGGVMQGDHLEGSYLAAVPPMGPFAALLLGSPGTMAGIGGVLESAGMVRGGVVDVEGSRIMAGWPALGAEIDERTLPQEVRFDEHAGVSYTKGCYTGQETVARLHFRGHANRQLRGIRWHGARPSDEVISAGDRAVGRVGSLLSLPDRTLGLGVVRRELGPGDRITAGGARAEITELPFTTADLEG
jgi:folate-binding protein YgfZ